MKMSNVTHVLVQAVDFSALTVLATFVSENDAKV